MKIENGKHFLKVVVVLVYFVVSLAFCGAGTESASGEAAKKETDTAGSTKIVIFHMNDVHAKISNFGKIAWIVNREREKNPNVFVMVAGDIFSGNPVVDQYEPKGKPILELLKKLKVDVMALGNHEFDYGQEALKNILETSPFPMLCANIDAKDGIIPQPEPYTILKTEDGIRLAVLGLIEVDKDMGIPSSHPMKIKGLKFTDALKVVPGYKNLREKCDVFIALSHLGIEVDEVLARQMGELDLIIGGHSHTTIKNPAEENGVLIVQTGGYTRYLGRVELVIKNGTVVSKKGELIDLKKATDEEEDYKKMIAQYNDAPHLLKEVAAIPMMLEGKDQLGNLIADAIRQVHKLDITFHNEGGTRSRTFGDKIRLVDVYKMLPFGNDIIQLEMTLEEIKAFIKYDYNRYKRLDLKVSGITYTVLHTPEKELKDVELRDTNGKPLDPNRKYNVGMNNYIASSYRFEHQDPGKALHTTIALTLIDYLKKAGPDNYKDIKVVRTLEKEVRK